MGLLTKYVGFEESPDFETKVNVIIDFWSNPCDAPWTVYVETLYPALGRMFLALVDTSLMDIARGYLRPREGPTRRNNRKKGRRRGKRRGIPDSADLVARMIPGASIFAGNEYGANTKFLWQIDGIIQRGLWYVVVIDATAEGFYWWAQGIKEIGFCKPINRPTMFATSPAPFALAFAGLWFIAGVFTKQWGPPNVNIFLSSLELPHGRFQVTFHGEYHNQTSFFGRIAVRLRGAGPAATAHTVIAPGEKGTVNFTFEVTGPRRTGFESKLTGTLYLTGIRASVLVRAL